MEWLRDLKEGDRVGYSRQGSTEICTVSKSSFRFVYVKGIKFSKQTGYEVGSARSILDVSLKKFDE